MLLDHIFGDFQWNSPFCAGFPRLKGRGKESGGRGRGEREKGKGDRSHARGLMVLAADSLLLARFVACPPKIRVTR